MFDSKLPSAFDLEEVCDRLAFDRHVPVPEVGGPSLIEGLKERADLGGRSGILRLP